jgi:O-antigen/teichoic acid export membrane protein
MDPAESTEALKTGRGGAAAKSSRGNISFVGLSSIFAAGSGYAIFVLAARVLPVDQNADFLAFWGVLFGLFGVMTGLMHEATRAVKSASLNARPKADRGARIIGSSVLIGAVVALAVALSGTWWMPSLFKSSTPLLSVGLTLAVVLYAGHVGLAGTLGGRESWGSYAALTTAESGLRLAAVAAVAVLGFGLGGLELAALSGTLVWLVFVFLTPQGRAALGQRADVGMGAYLRRCGYSMATAASSAVLITGFPALIKLMSDDAEFARAAPLLLAVSLTRAPILIPLQAFQGLVMTKLMASGRPPHRNLLAPLGLIAVGGLGAGLLAALIGPSIMLIFGPDYRLDGLWVGLLTVDAALLAVVTLTGTAALSAGRHRVYLAGWFTATAVSVALLAVPAPLDLKVVCSLAAGPLAGSAVHIWGLWADRRRGNRSSAEEKGI